MSAGPIAWILGLIGFGLVFAALTVFALWALLSEPTLPDELVDMGVVEPGETVLTYADLSPTGDLADGCLVTRDRAVKWTGRRVVSTVPLADATVDLRGADVHVRGAGRSAVCRFDDVGAAAAFADVAAREARRASAPRG